MLASSVLLVAENSELRKKLSHMITDAGCHVRTVRSLEHAHESLANHGFDVILVEDDGNTAGWRRKGGRALQLKNNLPVIAVARGGTIKDAVRAIQAGATDYICGHPLNAQELRNAVNSAVHRARAPRPPAREPALFQAVTDFDGFVTADYRMRAVCGIVAAVANSKATLLIEGESGTGKTLIAKMLHNQSPRRDAPFVELNCGVLTDSLIESELFGHARGAFTSAYRRRRGKFELAHNGTILLDEITNASPSLQAKLLQVVESGTYTPLGETQSLYADVRLVVASNSPIAAKVRRGLFREDLYHRINSVSITLPSLRDRVGDIPLIARHFLGIVSEQHHRPVRAITPEAMEMLVHYAWPGNVRELKNVIERGVILAPETNIIADSLPAHIAASLANQHAMREETNLRPLKDCLREPERRLILHALRIAGWNKQRAARDLGISRSTLYKKMREHGLERSDAEDERRFVLAAESA